MSLCLSSTHPATWLPFCSEGSHDDNDAGAQRTEETMDNADGKESVSTEDKCEKACGMALWMKLQQNGPSCNLAALSAQSSVAGTQQCRSVQTQETCAAKFDWCCVGHGGQRTQSCGTFLH